MKNNEPNEDNILNKQEFAKFLEEKYLKLFQSNLEKYNQDCKNGLTNILEKIRQELNQ